MIKFILKLLIDAFGLKKVNLALSEICDDEMNNATTSVSFDFYDKLSEAYDKVDDEFFRDQ